MASSTGQECEVCNEEFNEGDRCPRSLPCSHCLCTDCIEKLIATKAKICPFCRQDFQANSPSDIGPNTYLLDVLKLLKKAEKIAMPPSSSTISFHTKLVTEMKEETEKVTGQIMLSFRETKEQTKTVYNTFNTLRNSLLQSNEILQNEILVKINKILAENTQIVKCLDEKNRNLDIQMKKMNEKENQMLEGIAKLSTTETLAQTAIVVEEVDAISLDFQKWLQSHKELISGYMKTHQSLEEVNNETRDRVRILKNDLKPLESKENLISDLQLLTVQEEVPPEITIEALREKTEPVMDLIRQGRVFAFQELEGRRRYAQLSLEENSRICLHYLTERALPSDVHLLKHCDVMSLTDPFSTTTFLNFGTNEKNLGRIYISLTPNTKRAQNFSCLCTGEKGPCYLNSKIIEVRRKGRDGEDIVCGDYDGTGGKAVVSGTGKEKGEMLQKQCLAGFVAGWLGEDDKAAKFRIITRDAYGFVSAVFGKVESNLHILSEAISVYPNVSDIRITDCGIVIPI